MHIKVRLDGDWKMQRTKKKTKAMNNFKKTAHLGKNQCGQSWTGSENYNESRIQIQLDSASTAFNSKRNTNPDPENLICECNDHAWQY